MVWKKGQSGNPNGRPHGTSDITKLREAIAAHIPEIINRLVKQAKDGDTTAAKLLLERTLPPIRQKDETLKFALPENATLVDQGACIIQAIARGELTPSQGANLMATLANQAKLVEVTDIQARVEALEMDDILG